MFFRILCCVESELKKSKDKLKHDSVTQLKHDIVTQLKHESAPSSRFSSSGASPDKTTQRYGRVDACATYDVKSFTFSELKTATKNFRPDSMVGEGGFGCVFKGWIDENTYAPTKPGTGIVVAIKKLKSESYQGHKEWLVYGISSSLTLLIFV